MALVGATAERRFWLMTLEGFLFHEPGWNMDHEVRRLISLFGRPLKHPQHILHSIPPQEERTNHENRIFLPDVAGGQSLEYARCEA